MTNQVNGNEVAAAPAAKKPRGIGPHRQVIWARRAAGAAQRSLRTIAHAMDVLGLSGECVEQQLVVMISGELDSLATTLARPDWDTRKPARKAGAKAPRAAAAPKGDLAVGDRVVFKAEKAAAGYAEWLGAGINDLQVHAVAKDAKGRTRYLLRAGALVEGAEPKMVGFVAGPAVRVVK